MLIEHIPIGDPCRLCAKPASAHRGLRTRIDRRTHADRGRKYHEPIGDPCLACNAPASVHVSTRILLSRQRWRDDHKEWRQQYDKERTKDRRGERLIIGVDGEGVTLCYRCRLAPKLCECGEKTDIRHIYTYLAAVNEQGKLVSDAYNENGLSHDECCEMMLAIPKRALKFGFMFSYDVTKIIEEMPLLARYLLLRPEYRKQFECGECGKKFVPPRKICPDCDGQPKRDVTRKLRYKGRAYDFFNGALTISSHWDSRRRAYLRSCHVWDCFRFFGTSFVEAIRDWQIYSPGIFPYYVDANGAQCDPSAKNAKWSNPQLERIYEMKLKRGEFANESVEEVKRYCQEECYLLALLMRKVITSHDTAGLHLTRFHGAGSTAGVMLKKFGVQQYKEDPLREGELKEAVLSAFFGGRFEHSIIGLMHTPSRQRDVASAYPYSMTFHPCLKCGKWERVKGKGLMSAIERARMAVIRFRVAPCENPDARAEIAWMPLPFRSKEGSITYGTGFTGWAWKNEVLAALAGWPEFVSVSEAWVYNTECDHTPFSFMPSLYIERVKWGKEGPGKSLKLGMNAGYGKTAQSKGNRPPFQSWIWAGCTTSDCRAQLLRGIMAARDRWNVHALATDGICTTEFLDLEEPRDTGTYGLKKPPLGAWETSEVPSGLFYIKPGMYHPISDFTIDKVRARGIGRRELFKDAPRIIQAFKDWDRKDFEDYGFNSLSSRFYGAKHTIHARAYCVECGTRWTGYQSKGCEKCGQAGDDTKIGEMTRNGKALYGTWSERVTTIKFNPFPKREAVFGGDENYGRLRIRDMGGKKSTPYHKAKTSEEAQLAKEKREFAESQPDWAD